MNTLPTPCLLGATGSGKSAVSLALARRTNGEVIACDAFTVYRGMAILTAAPEAPPDVPHHLVSCLEPTEAFSAASFCDATDRLVPEIRDRGHTPWIVGGTALYLRSWLKGLGAPVARDPSYREALEAEAAEHPDGTTHLHRTLALRDPARAAEIHPNDLRRIVRALEIMRATGRLASEFRKEWSGPDRHPSIVYGLRRSNEDLAERIRRRTATMFACGVVGEARALLAVPPSPEAAMVLGLGILQKHIAGAIDAAEAEAELTRQTWRFARRQRTFFASFEGVRWIDVEGDEEARDTAAKILADYEASGTSA